MTKSIDNPERPQVVHAESSADRVILEFSDGTTATYGGDFLWKHRNSAGNVVEGKDVQPPGSPDEF